MQGSVTVHGLNFGQSDDTPSGRVDTAVCATAAWTSHSTVHCSLTTSPALISTEITVGGVAGTRYPQFTFDGPPQFRFCLTCCLS